MIKLLDCTLRDGGYINDWKFGKKAIKDIKENLEVSGVDIIELGFMRDEPANADRTIFNSIKNVKQLIGNKLPNREYAIMAEVSNPYPLEKLENYSEGAPDIIRVIIWKRMLQEGFEYCKGIVEKGYKLCVQPARVSQYSDQEFIDMIQLFNKLNPLAIYVVDSWGTMYKDELLHYLKLADENLKEGIAVGYHGHNNMMQAFDVAQAFCEQNLKRDLLIDASVYGIGRGAGNLNTEIFAKWANAKLGKNYNTSPLIKIYDKYIKHIYQHCEQWGFSIPYLITAKYNANPNFAGYLEKKGLSCEIIEKCIAAIPPQERIIFKPEIADKYLALNVTNQEIVDNLNEEAYSKYVSTYSNNKKLAVIVITANRPRAIRGLLSGTAKDFYNNGIDLIIFDSSSDTQTKDITEKFMHNFPNIIYDHWNGVHDENSIDNKVIDAYKKYSSKYQYLWTTRDGLCITINYMIDKLNELMSKGKDLIIVDLYVRDCNHHGSKNYTDPVLLFKEQCAHMNTLGTYILKSDFVMKVIKEIPIDDKVYGMYFPMALYYYYTNHILNAASYVGILWDWNSDAEKSSFWTKKILWQWGKRWYEMINQLPSMYDKYKAEVMQIETIDFKPFTPLYLAKARKHGGLNLKTVIEYQKYLPYVCQTPLWVFYLLAITPKIFVKKLGRKIQKVIDRNHRKRLKYYRKQKNILKKRKIDSYDK